MSKMTNKEFNKQFNERFNEAARKLNIPVRIGGNNMDPVVVYTSVIENGKEVLKYIGANEFIQLIKDTPLFEIYIGKNEKRNF